MTKGTVISRGDSNCCYCYCRYYKRIIEIIIVKIINIRLNFLHENGIQKSHTANLKSASRNPRLPWQHPRQPGWGELGQWHLGQQTLGQLRRGGQAPPVLVSLHTSLLMIQ